MPACLLLSHSNHPPSDRYLELQIHGEIRYDRDVDTLVVDKEEVNEKTLPWLDTFATKFGCKVMMFKDGNMIPFGSSQKNKKTSAAPLSPKAEMKAWWLLLVLIMVLLLRAAKIPNLPMHVCVHLCEIYPELKQKL